MKLSVSPTFFFFSLLNFVSVCLPTTSLVITTTTSTIIDYGVFKLNTEKIDTTTFLSKFFCRPHIVHKYKRNTRKKGLLKKNMLKFCISCRFFNCCIIHSLQAMVWQHGPIVQILVFAEIHSNSNLRLVDSLDKSVGEFYFYVYYLCDPNLQQQEYPWRSTLAEN